MDVYLVKKQCKEGNNKKKLAEDTRLMIDNEIWNVHFVYKLHNVPSTTVRLDAEWGTEANAVTW